MDNSETPHRFKVSVIIATFNAAQTIDQCLKSAVSQTHSDKEIIVVDGGSTDGTVAIIGKYRKHLAYSVSEPDKGVYDAWNKGVTQAKGDWICFIGADDFFWENDTLEKIQPHLVEAEAKNIRYVYGSIARMPRKGDEPLSFEGEPWEKAKQTYADVMSVTHSGSFHHRSLFERHGLFDDAFRICGDFEFMLRELPENDALFAADVVSIGMRYGGLTSSIRQKKAAVAEVIRARKKNGLPFSWRVALWRARVEAAALLQNVAGERATAVVADAYRAMLGKRRYFTRNYED